MVRSSTASEPRSEQDGWNTSRLSIQDSLRHRPSPIGRLSTCYIHTLCAPTLARIPDSSIVSDAPTPVSSKPCSTALYDSDDLHNPTHASRTFFRRTTTRSPHLRPSSRRLQPASCSFYPYELGRLLPLRISSTSICGSGVGYDIAHRIADDDTELDGLGIARRLGGLQRASIVSRWRARESPRIGVER